MGTRRGALDLLPLVILFRIVILLVCSPGSFALLGGALVERLNFDDGCTIPEFIDVVLTSGKRAFVTGGPSKVIAFGFTGLVPVPSAGTLLENLKFSSSSALRFNVGAVPNSLSGDCAIRGSRDMSGFGRDQKQLSTKEKSRATGDQSNGMRLSK
jgi:hypothetical protein